QWRDAGSLLANAKLVWFVAGGVSGSVAHWLIRAFRWRFLLRRMQVKVDLLDAYLCSGVALGLAVFTPGQSGEVLKVELLRRYHGVGRMAGYSALFVERIVDFYAVAA